MAKMCPTKGGSGLPWGQGWRVLHEGQEQTRSDFSSDAICQPAHRGCHGKHGEARKTFAFSKQADIKEERRDSRKETRAAQTYMQEIHPDASTRKYRSLLIPESPLQVLPSLAVAIGLDEAIVVQQLFWLLEQPHNGRVVDGHRWIFNTHEQWRATYFPFWSERTIRRVFTRLETMHIVASCQPEGTLSRRKYYRINEGMLNRMLQGGIPVSSIEPANLSASKRTKGAIPLTETSHRDDLSKESKETSSGEDVRGIEEIASQPEETFLANWKPDNRTKGQKLAAIRPPYEYPSEREFDAFLEASAECVAEYRSDLYDTLTTHKWRHWSERLRKWVRIHDWQEYVLALDTKIGGEH